MSFSYAKFIARRGGVVLASGPPVESVPGPTRGGCDHSLQTWRSLKHECEHNPLCIVYVLGHPTIQLAELEVNVVGDKSAFAIFVSRFPVSPAGIERESSL